MCDGSEPIPDSLGEWLRGIADMMNGIKQPLSW